MRGGRAGRGFTLLELLLAMVIGSMILAGGFALMGMAERMDGRFAARLETTNRLAFVQQAVGRSLQTIVVAPEGSEPIVAARASARTAARIDRIRRREAGEDVPEDELEIDPDAAPGEAQDALSAAFDERDVDPAPARFRMGHVDDSGRWEDRGEEAAEGLRRIELLLARPPVGSRERGVPVRGALDFVYTPRGAEDYWRLQWTPIRPAGKPTVLLEDLVLAEWSATDARGQFDQFMAYEKTELPWAVRVILWTAEGTKVDWMFDLGASSTTRDPL